MPRQPKPWWNAAKGAWYVQLKGKQHRLATAEREAKKAWHRLMAEDGRLPEERRLKATVPDVIDLFLDTRASLRPETYRKYVKSFGPFAIRHRATRFASIKPSDVTAYIESMPRWGTGTRHLVFANFACLFRWARDAGYLPMNPLAGVKNPWPAMARDRGMTEAEYKALLEGIGDPEMRLLLRVMRMTGCRPGEAYKLAARHLHETMPVATLLPEEHKTGGRTGRCRFIIFPVGLMGELRELARRYPEGPILRNTKGRPWNTFNVCQRFRLFRARFGLGRAVVPYSTRHAFITDMVHQGRPLPLVAKIVGHAGTGTIQSVYFHPDMRRMIELVEQGAEARPLEVVADLTGP